MTTNPFTDFIRFVECDRAFYMTEKLKAKILAEIKILEDLIAANSDIINISKGNVASLKHKMQTYELDIKDARARKKNLATRLERISNPKEYSALTKEIEELDHREERLEEELFSTWQAYEAALKTYEEQKVEFDKWLAHQVAVLDEKRKHIIKLDADLIDLVRQRSGLEKNVKPEFLHDFNQMKQSVVDPIVPLEENHCSACQYQVSLSDLAQIRKHVLVACRECFRKLYAP